MEVRGKKKKKMEKHIAVKQYSKEHLIIILTQKKNRILKQNNY